MRGRFEWLGLGCLLVWAGALSAQTVSVPTVSEVNRKLDSLAKVLRVEIGSKPSDPGVPSADCGHPVRLVSVYDVTASSLWYNFYSVGVVNIKETIRDASGKVVMTNETRGLKSDRLQIAHRLEPGGYTLTIENTDCDAVSNVAQFVVPNRGADNGNAGGGGKPEVPTEFANLGVYSKTVDGILYEWIPSELVDVQITDGRVKLIAPETKQSTEGKTCKRYVLGDIYDNKLSDSDERALFGDGLSLPPGQYAFKIIYMNAPSWEVARKNMWNYIGTDGGGTANSARAEWVAISITGENRIAGLDPNLWRVSWMPQYQLLPYSLALPDGKAFGVTRYITSVPYDSILSKITHIQYIYSWVDKVDKGKAWRNNQIYGGGTWQEPKWHIDHAILNKDYILMSEYAENYGNMFGCPQCIEKSEEIYKGIYKRFQSEQGITSPAQTWLGSDYFSHLYGGSFALNPSEATAKDLYIGLSSVNYARSSLSNGKWYLSNYFGSGWYDYRNYLSTGYLGNLIQIAGLPNLYGRVYNHEKAGLAISDRKKLVYGTPAQEGLSIDLVSQSGTWYRLPVNGGEILLADALIHSFETMRSDAFFALLLGDAYIMWDSSVLLNSDPATFKPSWYGGYEKWKTRWRPTGGTASVYEPGKNGAPVQVKANGQFPERPMIGDQGAWMGAKLYESILGKVDVLEWADYELNGKKIVAKRGSDGTAKANINGIQNIGQDNSAQVLEKQLPICLVGSGSKGRVLIYQNPNAGLTEEQGIEFEGRFYKVVGNRLSVIAL